MNARRAFLAAWVAILVLGLATPAAAQFTSAGNTGNIVSTLPTNGNNQISASALRSVLLGMNSATWQYLNTVTPPVLTACGTSPVVSTNSTTASGQFLMGGGSPTACTLVFGLPFTSYGFCTVMPSNLAAASTVRYISTQNNNGFTLTLTIGTSAAAFNYTCLGQ